MSPTAPTPDPTHPDPLREWTAQHLPALAELVEIGMNLARMMNDQAAKAAQSDTPADIGDVAQKFARVARAVRQTVALGAKLADDLDGLNDRAATRAAAQRRAEQARDLTQRQALGAERKAKAADLVERTVDRETPESDRENLLADLLEWRCETGFDAACADRPVADIFNDICQNLGIAPDWSRLNREALDRIARRPSTAATAYATWPPGQTRPPSEAADPGDRHPPPDAPQAQPPPRPN
jgi:hypothetical protein